jgi:hypothetical protein
MDSANIYLSLDDGRQVLALVIPYSDIRRLSLRHLKWLRYVTFALCGVRGDLCETPGGDPVDYNAIFIARDYYYTPRGISSCLSSLAFIP